MDPTTLFKTYRAHFVEARMDPLRKGIALTQTDIDALFAHVFPETDASGGTRVRQENTEPA